MYALIVSGWLQNFRIPRHRVLGTIQVVRINRVANGTEITRKRSIYYIRSLNGFKASGLMNRTYIKNPTMSPIHDHAIVLPISPVSASL